MTTEKDPKAPAPVSLRVTSVGKSDSTGNFASGLLLGPGQSQGSTENGKAVQSNALQFEDDFNGMYGMTGYNADRSVIIIEPPFNPLTLEKLARQNNALAPCISAMAANIDGTGFEIIIPPSKKTASGALSTKVTKAGGDVGDLSISDEVDETLPNPDIEAMNEFFAEPWPGTSFATIRKELRKDMETLGYGFLEVIRNLKGEILFVRHIEGKTMRLVKLDSGQVVTRKVKRGGKEVSTQVKLRFRRFVQKVGLDYVFFKEFQADTDLDKKTGRWAKKGEVLPAMQRASEVLYFVIDKDINTPYGIPRWLPQLPSILGSRSAEENNLQFFESGGVPPFLLMVNGGILAQETRDALETGLSSKGTQKQRGLVVEAQSSSGSLDDSGSKVTIQVEKFGGEKQNDSQFEVYDDKCERRIRGSFRLPAIFVGKSDNMNFASAFVSYMVGEAQIFRPERDEFDKIITLRLLPELLNGNPQGVVFRSLPIVINDAKERMLAVKMAGDMQSVTKGEFVKQLNEITGLKIKCQAGAENDPVPDPKQGQINGSGDTSISNMTDASTKSPIE